MSMPEFQAEQRSSVKIAMNAKGEAQVEVKVYVGTPDDEMTETRQRAVSHYLETVKAVRT